ncbi:peroxiredoxin Hyr1 [Blyttiomyces helicus]|uniref:Glutathione peroxidase n=1 Tax=Blyttiomyces helicus TaxID=388810 RepID=A0A4P9VVT2_9FUNG|nr:peroxiredoxin Hyr1 [Blyttiomyces helicus]|eukprot:RKO83242.1 peroxiredoxin Hyr1 [Blyttiomyces helicus]
MTAASFFDLKALDKRGQAFDIAALKGHPVLIVNVASQCGLTPHYKGLEALNKKYKDQGLVIVGFPCNQFGAQEPGTAEEAAEECKLNYGVSFSILEKIDVNGDNTHPVYQFLKAKQPGDIKWNFGKFLVGRDGVKVERFEPTVTPEDLVPSIEAALKETAAL